MTLTLRYAKILKYNFNDMNRAVVLAVGMSLDLYPGLVHPAEENDDDQQTSAPTSRS